MREVGIQLYGTEQLFTTYLNSQGDFDESTQSQIDAAYKAFISRYQVLTENDIIYRGPKGDILNMPQSSITYLEWNRILQIMEFKLGNDSFNRKFIG